MVYSENQTILFIIVAISVIFLIYSFKKREGFCDCGIACGYNKGCADKCVPCVGECMEIQNEDEQEACTDKCCRSV